LMYTLTALPVMFFFVVLLLCLPSASTTSTSPPRSCHLAVAEDRLALPALSSSLPVVRWSGSVDRVVRPHPVYPDRTKPSRTAAHTRRGYGVVSCSKSGRLGSVAAKEASTTSLAPPRQRRRAPSRRRSLCMPAARTLGYSFDAGHSHDCEAGIRGRLPGRGARSLEAAHDAPERTLIGVIPVNSCQQHKLRRHGSRSFFHGPVAAFLVSASQLRRPSPSVPSRHLEPSSASNTSTRASWADMRLLPTRRQVAVAPQWRVQWLLTRLHGDTALALSASAQGVPAPAALLVLKTLTEATAPCMLTSFAPSRGHGPLGCPGRQRPLCLACLSCCCSWPRAQ
jgi:hypothetical protein